MADIEALPLADVEQLQARLEDDITEDEALLRIAESALEDASDWARYYGSAKWVAPEVTPPLARKIVLAACKAYMENPSGYTVSRAGDETLQWREGDESLGKVEFSEEQIKTLGQLAGRGSSRYFFGSALMVAYSSGPASDSPGYVPVSSGGAPFPFYPSQDGPW